MQEISGAIIPLVNTYADNMPFYAAVLAGEFTRNSIVQLQSQGFYVLYFPYETICSLFDSIGLSIRWEEDTEDEEIQEIVDQFLELDGTDKDRLLKLFFDRHEQDLYDLSAALVDSLQTSISEVVIIPIHGSTQVLNTVQDAVDFIKDYNERRHNRLSFIRYEITVRYNNGDEYTMKCANKMKALQFLRKYQ